MSSKLPLTPIIDALEKPSDKGLVEPPMYFTERAKSWFTLKKQSQPSPQLPQQPPLQQQQLQQQQLLPQQTHQSNECQTIQTGDTRSDLFFYLMDLIASVIAIFMAGIALYRQRTVVNGLLLVLAIFLRYVYLAFRVFTFLL